MLSVTNFKFPRKIYIKIAKAEKLVLSKKDNKKKNNSKFRVLILGGKKKETSPLIDDISGNPEWNFSCTIKLHRGKEDPVCLHVEDSEGHHKGQVVIPLVKIGPKPYTFNPDHHPATSNNIICSELEPTKKCSNAKGYLIYWIWVEEYFTQDDGESKTSFKHSMSSIFGSMNVIGSSKTRKSDITGSHSNISSAMSLNKPRSHKKPLSFLHIKSKKSKVNQIPSDYKATPDSSDAESNISPGNTMEILINESYPNPRIKRDSFESFDIPFHKISNPIDIIINPPVPENINKSFPNQFAIDKNDCHSSISESGSYSKYEDDLKTDHKPSLVNMTSVTLPSMKINLENNQEKFKDTNNPAKIQNILEDQYKKGHNPRNESDYSIFCDSDISEDATVTIKKDHKSTSKETAPIIAIRANITSIKHENNEGPATLLSKIKTKHVDNTSLKQEAPVQQNQPKSKILLPTVTLTTTDYTIPKEEDNTITSSAISPNVIPRKVKTQPLQEVLYQPNKSKEYDPDINKETNIKLHDKSLSSIEGNNPTSQQSLNKLLTTDIKSSLWKEEVYALSKLESSSEDYQSANETIVPITLLPPETSIVTIENSITIKRDTNETFPSSPRGSNLTSFKDTFVNQDTNQNVKCNSPEEVDNKYWPNHKVINKSDSSNFNERIQNEFSSTTMKMIHDDLEILRKENSVLHLQNGNYNLKISKLQGELDCVKDVLCKLRSNLLVKGANKFLERI